MLRIVDLKKNYLLIESDDNKFMTICVIVEMVDCRP